MYLPASDTFCHVCTPGNTRGLLTGPIQDQVELDRQEDNRRPLEPRGLLAARSKSDSDAEKQSVSKQPSQAVAPAAIEQGMHQSDAMNSEQSGDTAPEELDVRASLNSGGTESASQASHARALRNFHPPHQSLREPTDTALQQAGGKQFVNTHGGDKAEPVSETAPTAVESVRQYFKGQIRWLVRRIQQPFRGDNTSNSTLPHNKAPTDKRQDK